MQTNPVSLPQAQESLQKVFGFDEFLAGQQAVVERLLAGRSTLAIFPTGGVRKGLCSTPLPAARRVDACDLAADRAG